MIDWLDRKFPNFQVRGFVFVAKVVAAVFLASLVISFIEKQF